MSDGSGRVHSEKCENVCLFFQENKICYYYFPGSFVKSCPRRMIKQTCTNFQFLFMIGLMNFVQTFDYSEIMFSGVSSKSDMFS